LDRISQKNKANWHKFLLVYRQRKEHEYREPYNVKLASKEADGYVIPLGTINLVNVVTDVGMVGCGAFDVAALNNFGYPAAKVRP
jgi:hypothetical protein